MEIYKNVDNAKLQIEAPLIFKILIVNMIRFEFFNISYWFFSIEKQLC